MYNLRWNLFNSELATTLDTCYEKQYFVDLSLVCKDGTVIKCHKMVLANSSTFFRQLLVNNDHPHPMILLHDIEADDLKTIVNFVYCGEIEVVKSDVNRLLKIAEILEISGLKDIKSADKFDNTMTNNLQKLPITNDVNNNKTKNNVQNDDSPNSNHEKLDKQSNSTKINKLRKIKTLNNDKSGIKRSSNNGCCNNLKKLRSLNEIEIICKPNEQLDDIELSIGTFNNQHMTPNTHGKIESPLSNINSDSLTLKDDDIDVLFDDDYDSRFPIARRAVRKKLFSTPGIEIFKSPTNNNIYNNLSKPSLPSTSRSGSTSPTSNHYFD